MKQKIFILFLLLTLIVPLSRAQSDLESIFSKESFTLGQSSLPYRKAEVLHDTSMKPALVLYLHGGSSRGNDNETQLKENAVNVIYQYLLDNDISATFIVPQCPSGGGWTSQNRRVVNELLKRYIQTEQADPDRVYIMGGSMGGTGTWCQLSYYPNFYAAAMPVAGNPTGCDAANVATTPVLTVMGSADAMMSIDDVEYFMTDVIAAGGTIQLDIEQGWSHPITCEQSYTKERLDWLFSHTKSTDTGIQPSVTIDNKVTPLYNLQGVRVEDNYRGVIIKEGRKVLRK